MEDLYMDLEEQYRSATCSSAFFAGLLTPGPVELANGVAPGFVHRHSALREWQMISLDLFQNSLTGAYNPDIANLVLGDIPDHLGHRFHKEVSLSCHTPPVFFRTDEAGAGNIIEVQCPGSAWGIYEQLQDVFRSAGRLGELATPTNLSCQFGAGLSDYLDRPPILHHLLDSSSDPGGERYFIHKARAHVKYYGYDRAIRPQDCNFIRGHDFFGLMSDTHLRARLEGLRMGTVHYDLPPMILFDTKIALSLPFWKVTREFYPEHVREIFPYTQVLTPEGFELEDGSWITIEEFSRQPLHRRRYFIKYAGCDTSRNWGSKSVYYLEKFTRGTCEQKLKHVTCQYHRGDYWIIQKAHLQKEEVDYLGKDGNIGRLSAYAKYSGFYGPQGLLGVLVMYEPFYKVHASNETVVTIAKDCASSVSLGRLSPRPDPKLRGGGSQLLE